MQRLILTQKTTVTALVVCLSLFWGINANASPLTGLKNNGLIGERMDGYIGVVQSDASSAIHAQVTEVNNKRRAAYQRIADKNKLSLEEVAALAGRKTIQKTPPGQWIFTGTWQKK